MKIRLLNAFMLSRFSRGVNRSLGETQPQLSEVSCVFLRSSAFFCVRFFGVGGEEL